jgi:hypothetical protein
LRAWRITTASGDLGESCAYCVGVGVSRLEVENRFIDYFKETRKSIRVWNSSTRGSAAPFPSTLSSLRRTSAPLPGLEAPVGSVGEPLAEDDPFAEDFEDPFTAGTTDSADDPFADDSLRR